MLRAHYSSFSEIVWVCNKRVCRGVEVKGVGWKNEKGVWGYKFILI